MQTADLGADECLDPALMSAFEDGAVDPFGPWYADKDAGPPSPFDMSTIDPDLLALYPEQNGCGDLPAASPPIAPIGAPDLSPSPLPNADASPIPHSPTTDIAMPTAEDNMRGSPPTKRVRFATLPPRKDPSTPSPRVYTSTRGHPVMITRVQARKRTQNGPVRVSKKYTAICVAKRTISDGTLVPTSGPCARCEWEEEECLIKYPGAACNTCRRRGRRCELVDERGKFNGQRAKELRVAEAAAEK